MRHDWLIRLWISCLRVNDKVIYLGFGGDYVNSLLEMEAMNGAVWEMLVSQLHEFYTIFL